MKHSFFTRLLLVLEINAVLQSRRDRYPSARRKHVNSSSLIDVVKEVGAGEEGAIEEGNHKGSPFDTLESEKDLVPCLRVYNNE